MATSIIINICSILSQHALIKYLKYTPNIDLIHLDFSRDLSFESFPAKFYFVATNFGFPFLCSTILHTSIFVSFVYFSFAHLYNKELHTPLVVHDNFSLFGIKNT